MSGVVLRCPHCGTTRGAPGECDACHEAEVRYYCTNHSPGRWLESAACGQCGAKFGDPVRPPVAPTPPSPPASVRPPLSHRRRPPTPAPPEPPRRAPRWSRADPPPPDGRERRGTRGPTLDDILREAARPRRIPPEAPPAPDLAPVVRGLGGCLIRSVLLFLLLIAALVIGLFVFGGALLQMIVPRYY